MTLNVTISRILATCGAVLFLTTPVFAADNHDGTLSDDGPKLVATGTNILLAGKGKGHGYGPGDGTGNGGNGPKDGSGYGPGNCSTTAVFSFDHALLLARGGNGNGGNGPGDGTGNGGNGPSDGTGNGAGSGTCVNS